MRPFNPPLKHVMDDEYDPADEQRDKVEAERRRQELAEDPDLHAYYPFPDDYTDFLED